MDLKVASQAGGGVIYPARPDELVRWVAVATVATGVAIWAVTGLKNFNAKNRNYWGERAILIHGIVYAVVVVFLALVAGLDVDGVPGFGLVRVALHLAAVTVAVTVALSLARRRGTSLTSPKTYLRVYAGGLYVASLLAVALV